MRLPAGTRLRLPPVLLPLALAAATCARTLRGGFVWDDEFYLNKWIVAGNTLREVVLPGKALDGIPYYRPFSNLLGMLLFRLSGGEQPWMWHAANVALHVLATAGVWYLLRWWIAGADPARARNARLVGASLFACWPAGMEAVAWISARTESLMVVLLVWALALHLKARDAGRTSIPSALLFFLALSSKEVGIVFLPLAVAATWLLPPAEDAVRRDGRAGLASALWLPHVLAYVGYTGLRRMALGATSGNSLSELARQRLTVEAIDPAVHAWGYYVREALLLGPGSPYVEFPPRGPLVLAIAACGAIAVAVLLAAAIRPKGRPFAMAAVWFLVGLGPPLVIAVEPISVTAVAARYLYAPNVALAALAALAVARVPAPAWFSRRIALGAAAVACAILVAMSQSRLAPWMTSYDLWTRSLADNRDSVIPNLNLGIVLLENGRIPEGERHLRIAAYAARPIDEPQKQTTLSRIADYYVSTGQYDLARAALFKASHINGTREGTVRALTLAAALELLGNRPGGGTITTIPRDRLLQRVAQLEHAAELDPLDATPRLVLGILNESLGERVRARHWYREVARISISNRPRRDAALARADRLTEEIDAETDPLRRVYYRAQTHEFAGETELALTAYAEALALAPERTDLMAPYAELLAREGRFGEAVRVGEDAVRSAPENPFLWFNLGLYAALDKDLARADEALAEASTRAPRWWKPYYHRARILELRGDEEGAIDQYERMLGCYDGVEQIREHARTRISALQSPRDGHGRNPSPSTASGDKF